MKPLKREEKVLIYVMNHLNYLKEQGILEGGGNYKVNNTPEILKQMKDFEPTEKETVEAMMTIQQG